MTCLVSFLIFDLEDASTRPGNCETNQTYCVHHMKPKVSASKQLVMFPFI